MNYFNRNRLITIFLIALMAINIGALITIATKSRLFTANRRPPSEVRTDREPESMKARENRFAEGMSKRLDLSEEQQEGMKELWEANQGKMKPIMQQMDETRGRLNEAMGSRELDIDKIKVLNDSVAGLDKQIRDNMLEHNIKVRELLNDEQLDKYLEMHRKMRKRDRRPRREAPLEMIRIL